MGFWTEWALQCYRAVMFPVHCLLGLEAYAVDIRYISPQDDWGGYIYGYECNCGGYAGGSDGVCLPCSLECDLTTPTNS